MHCGGDREPERQERQLCQRCADEHGDRVRSRFRKLASAGRCRQCGSADVVTPEANKKQMCLTCWFKQAAANNLGSTTRWQDIADKWYAQGGICPYTGRRLTLGLDASLDHIVPKSVGGTNDTDNLQWVHLSVNRAKSALSEAEFLQLVADIYATRISPIR